MNTHEQPRPPGLDNTSTLTAEDYHLPEMRIAQAAVLANDSAAYLASAMDLGSLHPLPYASIHPTDKQGLAERYVALPQIASHLAIAAVQPCPLQKRSDSAGGGREVLYSS